MFTHLIFLKVETGKLGQKRAVKFISEFYESINIKEANGTENYFQKWN